METVDREQEKVKRLLEELRGLAERYSLADIRSGAWLAPFVLDSLEQYAGRVSERFFELRYPGLSIDAIIDERVKRARRRAAIAGALTAGAYTAAVAAAIASGGATTLVVLPASVAAFVTDLLFTTGLQLRLAYDISVLYGRPVALDDEREVGDLVRVALGITPAGGVADGAEDLRPAGATKAVRSLARETLSASKAALSTVGQQLLRRALVKLTLPAAAIPLSSVLNHYSAGRTAAKARRVFRDRARARKTAARMAENGGSHPRLLVEVLWLVVRADKKAAAAESWLVEAVAEALGDEAARAAALDAISAIDGTDDEEVLRRLSDAPLRDRLAILEAVYEAAVFDGAPGRRERKVVKRIARACRVPFDRKRLRS